MPRSSPPSAHRSRGPVARAGLWLSVALASGLILAACSAPGGAPSSSAGQAPTLAAGASTPAAPLQPGSSQASGEIDPRASEAPAAPVVMRSRTTGRPITLEVWLTDWEQDTQKLFNDQLVPAFEAANPDIAVNIQYLDWRVFTEKLIAAHAGGVLPDIYQAGAEYVAPLASKGMALELDRYVEGWGQKDDFYESAWNTVTYRGKTYGIPVISAPQALVYRKDLLAAAGVARAPTTWDELVDVARKTTRREGDKFLVSGFNARPIWQQYIWFLFQNGGDVFTPEGSVVVNSPEAVEALEFFAGLFNGEDRVASKSGIAAPTANVGAMAANLVAMQLGNQLTVRDFRANNPQKASELAIAEPTRKKVQVTTNWTDWLAISRQSKHPDAAWKLVQFVAEKDNLLKYNETMFFIPPRKSLRTAGYMADPQLQQFVTIMQEFGKPISTTPAALEVYQTILKDAVEDAVYGKKSSKQALDDAARKIERALKR